MPELRLVSDRSDEPVCQPTPVLSVALDGMRFGMRDVLGALALSIQKGETVALTGPSGVGKTTLMRIIAGLETRFDGDVRRPDQLAMVFQEPTLMPWRSVADNLRIPLGIDDMAISIALEEVGLVGRGNAFPNQLSLGQQRRLSLARAFAGQPDLLLLDEPFVSLDAELAEEMVALFEALRDRHKVATLLVTHAASEAQRLADRILTLSGNPARLG